MTELVPVWVDRLLGFARAMAANGALEEVVRDAVEHTRELCGADGASLLLRDVSTGELAFDVVVGGANARISKVRMRENQGLAGRCVKTVASVFAPNVDECPDFDKSFDAASGYATGSVIAVPLVHGGVVLGVLEAVRTRKQKPFVRDDLDMLETAAPHVTMAVYNAQARAVIERAQAQVLEANAQLEAKVRERTLLIGVAKREWELTFDAMREPISVQDGFEVRRANIAYAAATSMPIVKVPGQVCYRAFAGRDSPCPDCPLTRGARESKSFEMVRGPSTFEVTVHPAPNSFGAQANVVHYRDVTEAKRLLHTLHETERLASLGTLAAGAAHEINNPLGFVTANLSTLAAMTQDAAGFEAPEALRDVQEIVDESLSGVRRIASIVRGLKELARPVAPSFDLQGASLRASLRAAIVAVFGPGEDPRIDIELGPDVRLNILPAQLEQVLEAVLRNAHQATGTTGRIGVAFRRKRDRFVTVVSDEGTGIPRENLARIFEPFFTTRPLGQGVGLGLTVAYGIVRRFSGEVRVSSEPGHGTVVDIELPMTPSTMQATG